MVMKALLLETKRRMARVWHRMCGSRAAVSRAPVERAAHAPLAGACAREEALGLRVVAAVSVCEGGSASPYKGGTAVRASVGSLCRTCACPEHNIWGRAPGCPGGAVHQKIWSKLRPIIV